VPAAGAFEQSARSPPKSLPEGAGSSFSPTTEPSYTVGSLLQ
jgi:hypothetical protein